MENEIERLRLSYKYIQEQNGNMQSALEIAIEELSQCGYNDIIFDIKAVWRDGINGIEDWQKYDYAFDEEQILEKI